MTLYRFKLHPLAPWRTPWQADTLAGLLCAVCARLHGPDVLRQRLIDPMLSGAPPFVLSDAFPGDWLPAPLSIRAQEWPPEHYKTVKRSRWVTPAAFELLRRGESLASTALHTEMLTDDHLMLTYAHSHNTLSRFTGTTGEAESGLGLFARPDTYLLTHTAPNRPNASLNGAEYLSLYVRAASTDALELFTDLFEELAQTGFGADVATGRGQFDLLDNDTPMPDLDAPPADANAVVCLSTFQPGPTDPMDGLWEAFSKFGKLGPDLGLADVRKRTLILFRPGACFRTDAHRPFVGRAVPMNELLPPSSANELAERGVHVIHPAFGLAVPARIDWNMRHENK